MSEQLELTLGAGAEPPPSAPAADAPARTTEQHRAIAATDPYVFVEAGAGTGKTGVLVDRYCDAVEAAENGADAVLAFTFTEKAAGELRGRVRAELRRRAAGAEELGDGARARRLRELARSPGAWLTTIHGFCRRLLSAHPIAAGVDPGFRVLDAIEADLLAERAFEDAFDQLLAEPEPPRLALAAARQRRVLRDLVRGAHDELRSLGRERPELEPLPGAGLAGALGDLASAAGSALAELEGQAGKSVERCRERLADAAALAEAHRSGSEPDVDEVVGLTLDAKRFAGPAVDAYNAAVGRVVEWLAADLYDALRTLVELFGHRYSELKAERSGLDFEDLQLRAVRLLGDSEAVRDAWRERFTEILVDEFQDTNRLQVALIEGIRGPEAAGAARPRLFTVGDEFQAIYGFRHADVGVFRAERERGRALPLRGNFRADPGVLAVANALGDALLPGYRSLVAGRARREPAAAGAPAELIVVEKGGWDEEDVGLDDRGELDAPAERIAEAGHIARRLAELAKPVEAGGGGFRRGEMVLLLRAFTHVNAYEEALERAGLRPLVVGGRGYWSQQQVEDMRSLLGVLANPLDDEALFGALASPACGVSPDGLWLLRRAAGRRRHVWPTVERLFGRRADEERPFAPDDEELDAEERERRARRRKAAEAIPADDVVRLRQFCDRLDALRRRAPSLALDVLVDATATAFGYDLAVLQHERGRRRWANVRKLMQLGREYEAASGRDLGGFCALLRDRADRDDREPEAQTQLEGHDGVRVMTVHNAKGLEFPVVAVADLGRDLGAGGFPPAFRARPDADGEGIRVGVRLARAGGPSLKLFELEGLSAEASEEESAEDRRLAYVAATRAERRLILSGVLNPAALERCAKKGIPPARASVLLRLLLGLGLGVGEEGLEVGEPTLPGASVELADGGLAGDARVGPARALPGVDAGDAGRLAVRLVRPTPGIGRELLAIEPGVAADAPEPVSGRSLLADGLRAPEPVAAPHLSNAALELYARCGYRFYAERVLGLREPVDGEAGEGALAFGSAVHALLEWSARNRWVEPPAERVGAAIARGGIEPSAKRVERAREFVSGWLGSKLRDSLGGARTRLAPEAPFLLELGGAVVRGQLDLLVDAPGEPPLVVDYKTNRLDGREPQELMARYETQRDLYALAAASARGGESARTAFVFLERPDEPVVRVHDADAIAATRERLGQLVAGIAGGDFPVTERPHRELCHDCPARASLCIHPFERTMAEDPDAPEAAGSGDDGDAEARDEAPAPAA